MLDIHFFILYYMEGDYMEKFIYQSLLYDFYGELLTKKQKKIYEEVVLNDYSISEVARNENITRQGISDMIKRSDRILEEYERKLCLVEKFIKTKELISEIKSLSEKFIEIRDEELINKIILLSNSILDL